jgi:hypothetical protein
VLDGFASISHGYEGDFSELVKVETLKNPEQRKLAVVKIRKQFQERLVSGKNRWFFTKLPF